MNTHTISGGGGVQLHVIEAGPPRGPSILLIHGLSQCSLSWIRQLASPLAESCRLVALDLRGHGLSDKPRDAYGDSRLWADDINAVIDRLELHAPVLSGWSYGGIVIMDYIRHYGEDRIGGIQLVGAVTKLGSHDAVSVLSPEFLAIVPGFFSADVEESVGALKALLHLCVRDEPAAEDLFRMVGYAVSVPPYVRQGMLSRQVDSDDLLPQIRKPVLITHSAADAVVKASIVDQHKARLPHAQIDLVRDVGHAVFWDDAPRFNARLQAFAQAAVAGVNS